MRVDCRSVRVVKSHFMDRENILFFISLLELRSFLSSLLFLFYFFLNTSVCVYTDGLLFSDPKTLFQTCHNIRIWEAYRKRKPNVCFFQTYEHVNMTICVGFSFCFCFFFCFFFQFFSFTFGSVCFLFLLLSVYWNRFLFEITRFSVWIQVLNSYNLQLYLCVQGACMLGVYYLFRLQRRKKRTKKKKKKIGNVKHMQHLRNEVKR